MEEEFQYCGNCKRDISAKNYVIHTAHCERKIQLCYRCSEPVPRSELKEHEEEFHSNDICSDCGITVEKWKIEKHKETCVKKLVPCEYCELEVHLDSLYEHAATCGSRTEQCPKCNKHVMIKDLKKHPIDCLKREQETMPCEYCGLLIDWNELMEHTALCGTRTERCFLCNEHVMVQDRDTHFVICGKSMDFNESFSCGNCGGSFTRNTIERHVELCRSHLEKCKICNTYIQKEVMGLHLTKCEQELVKLEFPCNYCGQLFLSDFLKDHTDRCGSRTQKCEKCEKFIPLKNMEAHSDICGGKKDLKPKYPCKFCEELFPSDFLEEHANRCGSRTQKCKMCGKFILLKNMDAHSDMCLNKKDLKPQYPCKFCEDLFPSDFLEEHANRCGSQTEKCKKCGKFILLKNMDAHSDMCLKDKQLRLQFPCCYCGELFPSNILEVHANRCGSETQKCKECGKFIPLKDMEAHSNICEGRSVALRDKIPCKYCEIPFSYNMLERHITVCRLRTEKCRKCEKFIRHNEMDGHQCVDEQNISKTYGNCPICHQTIPWIEMNVHSAYCSQVYYDTPDYEHQNQFNELALRKESEGRVLTNKSTEEKKSQTFEGTKKCSFCSNIFPYRYFSQHLEICLERPYNCDKCLKAMPYRKKEDHLHSCRSQQTDYMLHDEETENNGELKKLKKCQFCDKRITDVLFHHHLKVCEHREEKCTVCSENVPVKNMQEHKLFKCNFAHLPSNRNFYSDNNVHAEASPGPSENFEKMRHLEVKVELCPSCNSKIPEERYHEHLLLCYNEMTQCHFCGEEIPKKKERSHFQNCDRVLAIAREDNKSQSSKKNEKANKKLKKCQFCDKRITDVLFHHHLKVCEHREEKCTVCSENVPVKNMQEHKLFKCNFAHLPSNRNFYSDNNVHAEASPGPSENFEKMRHLEVKVELCPSCNSKIPEERYHEHLLLCYNEMTQCHFCGEEIPKKKERSHFQNCDRVLAIAREDNKSQSSKKNEKANKGKSFGEAIGKYIPFLNSNKDKASGRNYSGHNYQEPYQSNRGKYEKVYRAPVQPPPTKPNDELPCEFCNQLWPAEFLIEHESGCRPDLISYPKSNEENENDHKLAIAAANASPISHISGLGARPKNTREENDEWREIQYRKNKQVSSRENFEFRSSNSKEENTGSKEVQSRRNNQASIGESIDYRKKEKNVHQNRSNDKDKFFFYSSQDTGEASENQSSNPRQKRHSQMRESPETSKVKSDKEFGTNCGFKKDESGEDHFTAFKFSSSKFNDDSQNFSNFRKENDGILSSDVKSPHDTKKSSSYCFQTFSGESNSTIEYSKPYINREIKAVGAERTEKKRIMHSKKDAEADLTLINKDFEEMSLQKLITSDENNKSELSKFHETADTNILSLNLPMIWNTEYNSNNNKTFRSPLLKTLNSNYDSKTEDDTPSNAVENIDHKALNNKTKDDASSKAVENIEYKALDSSIQDTDYDAKNDETFGNDFLQPIKNNQNKEDENDTHSNSDDIFYDADDEYFVNVHGSINPQEEKLSHYHLDNLKFSDKHQRDNVRQKSYEDLEERKFRSQSYEEDLNHKDSNLNGYIQFLRKSIKGSDEAIGNKMNQQEKLTSALKNGSSSSESSDTEPFSTRVKTSNQMNSKKSPLKFSGEKKVKDESFVSNETLKWKKWREREATDSD
ncbi:uncharacterized protein LOC129971596 isoform X2 [Argiope bruennichi]|uniref:uncharacterized protein LOC129971596 isoform X2 n=1 Tax=Argiope bruennichi TaxID=94029 RepID=UPI002493EBCC|nr:uncharacterized protein LOC129971596 isoform X2 [Argiope bruennichi]